jgi:hypothetical protein
LACRRCASSASSAACWRSAACGRGGHSAGHAARFAAASGAAAAARAAEAACLFAYVRQHGDGDKREQYPAEQEEVDRLEQQAGADAEGEKQDGRRVAERRVEESLHLP